MNEKEKKIQEEREILATKNNLMGVNGKLGCIVFTLGFPVYDQSAGGDVYSLLYPAESKPLKGTAKEINDAIPTMGQTYKTKDGKETGVPILSPYTPEWRESPQHMPCDVSHTGQWNFDGLSRGMHLEIRYREAENELCVWYKGYPVYKEANGSLEGYRPIPEWESWIDRLYKLARSQQKDNEVVEKQEDIQTAIKNKMSWWKRIVNTWGA